MLESRRTTGCDGHGKRSEVAAVNGSEIETETYSEYNEDRAMKNLKECE